MEKKISETQIIQFRDRLIEDEKSAATIQKYLRDVRAFYKFAGDRAVTKVMVIQYKQYLVDRYKPASVNSMLASVNSFFREIKWFDCSVKALKMQMRSFRDSQRELTKQEYLRLLKAAEKKHDKRLYLLMETICSTGIRVSEVPFITVEAVQNRRAVVSLKGKLREILIPKALGRELERYAKEKKIRKGSIFVTRNGNPLDRSNILHAMKNLCEEAKVERTKVFPHNLRHLFACLLYKAEKDLSRLADILGHSNVNTTRIYTCVRGEEQAEQIERLGLVVLAKEKTA